MVYAIRYAERQFYAFSRVNSTEVTELGICTGMGRETAARSSVAFPFDNSNLLFLFPQKSEMRNKVAGNPTSNRSQMLYWRYSQIEKPLR